MTAVGAETPAIEARSLYRFFRAGSEETLALQGVTVRVACGEVVALVGPSGSGKSTLLSCMAGTDDPDGGAVQVRGERLSHRSEATRSSMRGNRIGLVFQSANLLAHLNVRQNVLLAQRFAAAGSRANIASLLDSLGIRARERATPDQLSGGELARAGLAVALANQPAVLLADEPTGELDHVTERGVLDLIRMRAHDGLGVLLASHSPAVAAAADRVVRLSDGRIVP